MRARVDTGYRLVLDSEDANRVGLKPNVELRILETTRDYPVTIPVRVDEWARLVLDSKDLERLQVAPGDELDIVVLGT